MELKVSVSEALALIKEVESVPAKIFEYIGVSIQEAVGSFLTNLMGQELTHHLGRDKYERKGGRVDYRNGSYTRTFCVKGVGDVELKIPRDRDGDFTSQVIPGTNSMMTVLRKTWQPCISPVSAPARCRF